MLVVQLPHRKMTATMCACTPALGEPVSLTKGVSFQFSSKGIKQRTTEGEILCLSLSSVGACTYTFMCVTHNTFACARAHTHQLRTVVFPCPHSWFNFPFLATRAQCELSGSLTVYLKQGQSNVDLRVTCLLPSVHF